jgi:hypothetical protein
MHKKALFQAQRISKKPKKAKRFKFLFELTQFKKVQIPFFTETVQKGSKLFFKPEKAQKSSKSPFSGSKKLKEAQKNPKKLKDSNFLLSKHSSEVEIAFFTQSVQKGSKLFYKPEKAKKCSKILISF